MEFADHGLPAIPITHAPHFLFEKRYKKLSADSY
jgi:hypothetical protein